MDAVKKRRILLFLCWLAYVVAYIGRYSYSSNINFIMSDFDVDQKTAGLAQSMFFFAYGAGQVINGIFCKKYNKKYVLSAAMLISAGINLAVFLGVPFAWIKYLWLINGAAQSFLWSSLILIISENMPEKEIKKAVLVMSTTVAFGTFAAYGVSALLAIWGIYKFSFLTGTVALGITGVVWLIVFGKVNNPIKTVTDEENVPIAVAEKKKQKLGASVWSVIILLAVFAVVNNLVKDGLTTWVPRILKVNYGLSDSLSILLTLVLPVIAIFGATLAVALNKKIKNYIIICGVLFLLSTAFTVAVKLLLGTDIWVLVLICFAAISMLMASVNNVITSMAPLYMRDKINPGLLTGVLDGFCYLGSTISMYGLGALADAGGWGAVFTLLLALVAFCFVIAAVYAVIGKLREKKKPKFVE